MGMLGLKPETLSTPSAFFARALSVSGVADLRFGDVLNGSSSKAHLSEYSSTRTLLE